MERKTEILHYESISKRRGLRESLASVKWFLFDRKLRPLDAAIGGIFTAILGYGWFVINFYDSGNIIHYTYLYALALAGAFTAVVATLLLYSHRAWFAASSITFVLVVMFVFSGMFQIARCPHATYLQTFGKNITIAGERCGNQQDIRPWWMKD